MPDQEKDKEKDKDRDRDRDRDREREKDKAPLVVAPDSPVATILPPAIKSASEVEEEASHYFFGEPLVGFDPAEITGSLVVIEGMDGSGRSTQITLLQEWLESEGFAVQTSGLRRSNLVGSDIDQLLAKNAVTRLTLALMYATDFFDQVEHRILPALRSGTVVLADRFIFTLIARGVVSSWHQSRLHDRPICHGSPAPSNFLAQRPPRNRLRPRIQKVPGHQLL